MNEFEVTYAALVSQAQDIGTEIRYGPTTVGWFQIAIGFQELLGLYRLSRNFWQERDDYESSCPLTQPFIALGIAQCRQRAFY